VKIFYQALGLKVYLAGLLFHLLLDRY